MVKVKNMTKTVIDWQGVVIKPGKTAQVEAGLADGMVRNLGELVKIVKVKNAKRSRTNETKSKSKVHAKSVAGMGRHGKKKVRSGK